jgi:hypothetical protein
MPIGSCDDVMPTGPFTCFLLCECGTFPHRSICHLTLDVRHVALPDKTAHRLGCAFTEMAQDSMVIGPYETGPANCNNHDEHGRSSGQPNGRRPSMELNHAPHT